MSIDHKLDLETLNGICPSGYFKSTPCVWKPDDDHESSGIVMDQKSYTIWCSSGTVTGRIGGENQWQTAR